MENENGSLLKLAPPCFFGLEWSRRIQGIIPNTVLACWSTVRADARLPRAVPRDPPKQPDVTVFGQWQTSCKTGGPAAAKHLVAAAHVRNQCPYTTQGRRLRRMLGLGQNKVIQGNILFRYRTTSAPSPPLPPSPPTPPLPTSLLSESSLYSGCVLITSPRAVRGRFIGFLGEP